MSDEPKRREPIEANWQPIGVVSLDTAATKPPKSRWRSLASGVMLFSLVWGAQDSWTAYISLKRADPPLRAIALEDIRSRAITGSSFLVVGSVLFGCLLGLWIADLQQRRTQNRSLKT
jgi:hypothetical protein